MTSDFQYTEHSSEQLIKQLQARSGQRCSVTGSEVGTHEALLCIIYGFGDRLMTLGALAEQVGRGEAELCREVWPYIEARECFRDAWNWANEYEPRSPLVSLRTIVQEAGREADGQIGGGHDGEFQSASIAEQDDVGEGEGFPAKATLYWNAQDMGCGELLLQLRQRISAIPPGQILCVRATDLGAPEDLPAWCGLVGHKLVDQKHPKYWIRRRQD